MGDAAFAAMTGGAKADPRRVSADFCKLCTAHFPPRRFRHRRRAARQTFSQVGRVGPLSVYAVFLSIEIKRYTTCKNLQNATLRLPPNVANAGDKMVPGPNLSMELQLIAEPCCNKASGCPRWESQAAALDLVGGCPPLSGGSLSSSSHLRSFEPWMRAHCRDGTANKSNEKKGPGANRGKGKSHAPSPSPLLQHHPPRQSES